MLHRFLQKCAIATFTSIFTLSSGGCQHDRSAAELKIEIPEADQDAEVYVDGNYVGIVRALHKELTGSILLAPGNHRLEIRKPGRFPVQKIISVQRPAPAQIVIQAELLADPLF